MAWLYGEREGVKVYATDDPQMARVVARGRPDQMVPVFSLLKFGWELDEPPGWPNTDADGNLKESPPAG